MIGVLIIAHAPLAGALAQCALHAYSCDPARAEDRVRVLDVPAGADVKELLARARVLLAELDDGAGVLVLTDAFGATPGNIAWQLANPPRVAVVAGGNLPMLLRTLCYRDGKLADTVEKALAGGTQGVMQVVSTPVQNQGFRPQGDDYARIHHQQ
jgi:PTS system ascorbate-specific IIA component